MYSVIRYRIYTYIWYIYIISLPWARLRRDCRATRVAGRFSMFAVPRDAPDTRDADADAERMRAAPSAAYLPGQFLRGSILPFPYTSYRLTYLQPGSPAHSYDISPIYLYHIQRTARIYNTIFRTMKIPEETSFLVTRDLKEIIST